jgi:hypothetical protein
MGWRWVLNGSFVITLFMLAASRRLPAQLFWLHSFFARSTGRVGPTSRLTKQFDHVCKEHRQVFFTEIFPVVGKVLVKSGPFNAGAHFRH